MTKSSVFFVFPHQLFSDISELKCADEVYLVEEFLFFNQYKFHKQKLHFHRSTMKYYQSYLSDNNINVHYIDAINEECDIRILIDKLAKKNITEVHYYDVSDFWLEKRLSESCRKWNIKTTEHTSKLFINTKEDLKDYFENRKKYYQTDFYTLQRKKLGILVEIDNKPVGGKWSYDADNRLKYPKGKTPPTIFYPEKNHFHIEAFDYIAENYDSNYGKISDNLIYPNTHKEAEEWMNQFFEQRFAEFGEYEDAIVSNEIVLNHSLLSPLINVGLLLPMQVVNAAIVFAQKNDISLNSLEGFIRQIIGWREFIRGVYHYKGVEQRTKNYWNFSNKLPNSFYSASTGIEPLDVTIEKVIDTGYCHHIERLMILGNFMVLTETNPNEVYRWFMEMYIDAYDWVMVPNVYGMSQFADGGLMATKPYISGSNYLMKMSDFKKGEWQATWDALFWRFLYVHRDFFKKNPRLNMLLSTFDKMSNEKQTAYIGTADKFLESI